VELVSAADFLVRYRAQSILVELLLPLGAVSLGAERFAGRVVQQLARPAFKLVMPFYLAT
jgi:hypothetical protein